MIRRDARPDDDHFGKYNGLGGKLELDESVVEGARRELREEASVELDELTLRATITWSNFGPKGEEWLGFVFLATSWTGDAPDSNDEGTLHWIPRSRLLAACDQNPDTRVAADLPMWEGDRHFVPLIFDEDPRTVHGTMPYDRDRPVSWSYDRI